MVADVDVDLGAADDGGAVAADLARTVVAGAVGGAAVVDAGPAVPAGADVATDGLVAPLAAWSRAWICAEALTLVARFV